jgi:hypothetical protein
VTDLSKIQTVELTREQLSTTIKDPSNYYIVNAFGNRVYIKTTDRVKAQEKADEMYGKGFYNVRAVSDKDDLGKKQWNKPEEYKPVRGTASRRYSKAPN